MVVKKYNKYFAVIYTPKKYLSVFKSKQKWIALNTSDKKEAEKIYHIVFCNHLAYLDDLLSKYNTSEFTSPSSLNSNQSSLEITAFPSDSSIKSNYDLQNVRNQDVCQKISTCSKKSTTAIHNNYSFNHYSSFGLFNLKENNYQKKTLPLSKGFTTAIHNNYPIRSSSTLGLFDGHLCQKKQKSSLINENQNDKLTKNRIIVDDPSEYANQPIVKFKTYIPTPSDYYFSQLKKQNQQQLLSKPKKITFIELVNEFIKIPENKIKPKDYRNSFFYAIRAIQEILGANKCIQDTSLYDLELAVNELPYISISISKDHNMSFLKAIEEGKKDSSKCIKSKTLKCNYLSKIKTLYEYALKRKYITENTFDQINLPVAINNSSPNNKYSAFTTKQLNALFNMPLYRGSNPKIKRGWYNKAGTTIIKDEHYWFPLIGLFTGARINEIAQLRISDIKYCENFDIYYFDINEEEDKHLKRPASVRHIPIHSKLLKMGFIDYVNTIKKSNNTMLFPNLKKDAKDGYSANMSKWFGIFLKNTNKTISDPLDKMNDQHVFHSFRHTIKNEFFSSDYDESDKDIFCCITGWEIERKSSFNHYGSSSFEKLLQKQKNILEKFIKYDEVDLSHLFVKPKAITEKFSEDK